MRPRPSLLLAAALAAGIAQAGDPSVQRALIERDQQSEAFARQLRQSQDARQGRNPALEARQLSERQAAENLEQRQLQSAGQPLAADPVVAGQLQPYERQRAADERTLRLPPPVVR